MAWKIVSWIVGILGAMITLDFALLLISMPSTGAVIAGIVIILAMIFTGIKIGQKVFKQFN